MTDVTDDKPKTEAPAALDMRSEMEAVFDKLQATDDGDDLAPDASEDDSDAGEPSESAEGKDATTSPARAPDGKFTKKDDTSDRPNETPATEEAASTQPAEAPVSWSQDAKAAWAALPPAVQQAVLKRESEASSGIKSYSERVKALEPIERVIGPRAQALASEFGSVDKGIETLFQISDFANRDPAQFIQWYAQNTGLDLSKLATGAQPQPVDPQIAQLHGQVSALQQRFMQEEQTRQAAEDARIASEIQAFAADKPDFDALRPDMGKLIAAGLANSLPEAYEKARYANPQIREQLIKQQQAEAAEKARAEAEKRAKSARRQADIAVATSGPAGATAPAASLRDTLRQAYDQAQAARA